MDSPGVQGDILFFLAPLRAGRGDKHFLYHSDTHLLSLSASKTPRAGFCATEMLNGFSLSFPTKKLTQEMFFLIVRLYFGINETVKLHHIQ